NQSLLIFQSDTQVTFEDQQKINRFARTNARLMDLKEELTSKEVSYDFHKFSQPVKVLNKMCTYQIGEVLVEMTAEEAQAALEVAKGTCQGEIDALKVQADGYKQTLSDLKTQLYAKFGTNINLDLDDES
ncbi:hypothetical protein EGW08_009889, partial [Elysia chlorotica]